MWTGGVEGVSSSLSWNLCSCAGVVPRSPGGLSRVPTSGLVVPLFFPPLAGGGGGGGVRGL